MRKGTFREKGRESMRKEIRIAFDRYLASIRRGIIHALGGYVPEDNYLMLKTMNIRYEQQDLMMVFADAVPKEGVKMNRGTKKQIERELATELGMQLLRGRFVKINWDFFTLAGGHRIRAMVVAGRKSKT